MKHFYHKAALALCACALLVSCKEKKSAAVVELPQIPADESSGDHQWYYITSRGLERCDLPQRAVLQLLRPWTENLRIADSATGRDDTGLLLVNRLGVLVFQNAAEPLVLQDVQLFGETTADTLVFDGDQPYFSLYRSTFFNKSALVTSARSAQELNRPYLVRVSPQNQMLYPVVTYGDLQLQDGGEVSGSYFDGNDWLLSIKTTNEEETGFRYLSWKPIGALDALMPVTKPGKIVVTESKEESFRDALSVQPLATAPDRLQKLLASIPDSFGFQVACKTAGGASERTFETGEPLSSANAVIADGWICAIFADGTSYFNGALSGRQLVADGATVAFRLPKLPKNYFYTQFCISGDYLAVGWEERDFYKTARSGILVVDVAQVFYTKAAAVLKPKSAEKATTALPDAAAGDNSPVVPKDVLVGGDAATEAEESTGAPAATAPEAPAAENGADE